jgi:UDP-3-O-[3-hydroxymyristoyl] glucosamine N-acyltransferase
MQLCSNSCFKNTNADIEIKKLKLKTIAKAIGGECRGQEDTEIYSIAPAATAGANQLTFIANSRFLRQLVNSRAGAVILREGDLVGWDGSAIVCADPYVGYARTAQILDTTPVPDPGQHPSAVVADDATIDPSASIGAHCVVEKAVRIGKGVILGHGCVIAEGVAIGAATRLYANVTVYHGVVIGERCIVQSGAVLGSDGFGNAKEDGRWIRIPQLGTLRVGNDVQIGANTTIDRGALNDTVIGNGVVIDNQVHIAHNCLIGDHTGIAGCVGIAGSVEIGCRCTLAGGVGVVDNVTIVDDVHITTMTLISSSISSPGVYSSGTGQMLNRQWRRSVARFRQLDRLARRLKSVEQKIYK